MIAGAAGLAAAATAAGLASTALADEAPATETEATQGPGTRYTTFPNVDEIGIVHDASAEEDADLVVVGSGIGGLMCAMITAENAPDAKVILVEQRGFLGGGTNFAEQCDLPKEGLEWADALKEGDETARISHFIKDAQLLAQKAADQGMNSSWLFLKHAIPLRPQRNPRYEGGNGSKTIARLQEMIETDPTYANVEIRMNTRGTALLLDDEYTCTGIQLRDQESGEYTNVNTKAVYLGAGGMSNNLDLLRAYSNQDMCKLEALDQGHYGDGHLLAEQTAHGICKTVALSSMMGYVPGFSYQSILNACVTTNPTCVFVNQDGVRFTSEDVDTIKTEDDIMFLVHYSKLVEGQGKVFSIVGSDLMDLFRNKEMKFSTGFYGQPEQPLEEWDADEELNRYLGENENLYSADTLEELAEKIGVPVDAFVETIQTYDADCEAGTGDSAFGKDASSMIKVGEGPYYAFGLKSFLVNTNNGIRVNKDCQVCDPYYTPVSGLYAGGISISGFNDEIYHTGLCQAVAVFSGSRSARHLVENCLGGTVAEDWFGDELYTADSELTYEEGYEAPAAPSGAPQGGAPEGEKPAEEQADQAEEQADAPEGEKQA